MNKMMIARRRIIESLSKISRWIYKAGDADFFEGSKEGSNYGLSFSPIAARRLRLSPYTLHWVTIYVPGGDQVREEKQIGGYVNIGDTLATGELRPYDFTPYKQIVIEVESGSGVVGEPNGATGAWKHGLVALLSFFGKFTEGGRKSADRICRRGKNIFKKAREMGNEKQKQGI